MSTRKCLAEWLDRVTQGDCLAVLPRLPDNSIDLVLTDPPYGLKFMGRDWDRAVPPVDYWRLVLHKLKPGAFAFVMSSPRLDCLGEMSRRLAEAGFRIDFTPIFWATSQGFPKAENIAKAVDKRLGVCSEVVGEKGQNGAKFKLTQALIDNGGFNDPNRRGYQVTRPASEEAKALEGSYGGFQLKPAVELILCAMKPPTQKSWARQALENGKGIAWFDDCRIPFSSPIDAKITRHNWKPDSNYDDDKTLYKLGIPKLNTHQNEKGRFPANLLVSNAALNDFSRYFSLEAWWQGLVSERLKGLPPEVQKTFPFLVVPKASARERNLGLEGLPEVVKSNLPLRDGSGDYVRNEAGDGSLSTRGTKTRNTHCCVKPVKLMAYLVTLGSRPDDIVLDPFLGSGTTAMACKMLGRHCIGIELEPEYCRIAKWRVAATAESERPLASE
jgi:site-specific DNA-methyltransferase (adenine-specific)